MVVMVVVVEVLFVVVLITKQPQLLSQDMLPAYFSFQMDR